MNKMRRKELAKIIDLLSEAKEQLEAVRDDEEEAFDNLPESLQESECGQSMQNAIDAMNDVLDTLDLDDLEEIAQA